MDGVIVRGARSSFFFSRISSAVARDARAENARGRAPSVLRFSYGKTFARTSQTHVQDLCSRGGGGCKAPRCSVRTTRVHRYLRITLTFAICAAAQSSLKIIEKMRRRNCQICDHLILQSNLIYSSADKSFTKEKLVSKTSVFLGCRTMIISKRRCQIVP